MAGDLTPEMLGDEHLRTMSEDEFDRLPFGVIKLDDRGRVVLYNAVEASLAKRRPTDTVGKRFFEDIAPCTNVAAFRGRLEALRASKQKTVTFDFDFDFPWGERAVRIRFWIGGDGASWVFVSPL